MSFEDELSTLREEVDELKESLEEIKENKEVKENEGPTQPAYAPPKYPAGLYPISKLASLITKLAKEYKIPIEGSLKDFIEVLKGKEERKKEVLEAVQETIAVLPSANQSLLNMSDQGADLLAIEKFGKERGWKPFEGEEES